MKVKYFAFSHEKPLGAFPTGIEPTIVHTSGGINIIRSEALINPEKNLGNSIFRSLIVVPIFAGAILILRKATRVPNQIHGS